MDTNVDYPRTLIIGAHMSEQSGSGTFLGRLFSGWPADRLATVSAGTSPPDWRRCHRHYRVGDLELHLRTPFRWLVPSKVSGPVLPPSTAAAWVNAESPHVSLGCRLAQCAWYALLRFLSGGEILYRVDLSPQLLAWVREFQPDVIYGHCSDLRSVRFLRRMQQALGLPLILHIMDDFPEALYRKGWVSRFLRPRYLTEFTELVRSAKVAMAICQEMAEEYETRYRRPVQWLPMPVELGGYQTAARTQWAAGRPFRLRYGGRVGWAIRESLADLAAVVRLMRQEGTDVVFDLVTCQRELVPAVCLDSSGVAVRSLEPLADLPRLQAEADVLVVCYDFDSESFRNARYSMPAKMAACMASGTPILVYGPAGLPVVEYARKEGWGKVVDRRDPVALASAVRELMESATLREQLARTAQRLATERHDAQTVAKGLCTVLQNVSACALVKGSANRPFVFTKPLNFTPSA